MKKRISAKVFIVVSVLMLCALMITYVRADAAEKINVNITVTDIRDVYNPFNVLVPRRELTVEYEDLGAVYGGTFSDIEMVGGITYLHALVALHKEMYGKNVVSSFLMLDDKGETHLFMGQSIDSIMYKNGDDIFTLPQYVQLKDGDEINVCIYTAGHQQQVATFDKSVITVPIGAEIPLAVSEHYDSPVDNTPISGAQITDENGLLLFDENGDIITSDEMGNFTVSYDEEGTYILSVMPEINYYMTGKVQEKVTYIPVGSTQTFTMKYGTIYDARALPEGVKKYLYPNGIPDDEGWYGTVYIPCEWGGDYDPDAEGYDITYGDLELEKVVEYIPDEPKQMITYTPPFCVIEVTDDLIVNDVTFANGEVSDGIYIDLTNAEYSDCMVYCAAYKDGHMTEVQLAEPQAQMNFAFGTGNDYYKVMFLEGLTPVTDAYRSKE